MPLNVPFAEILILFLKSQNPILELPLVAYLSAKKYSRQLLYNATPPCRISSLSGTEPLVQPQLLILRSSLEPPPWKILSRSVTTLVVTWALLVPLNILSQSSGGLGTTAIAFPSSSKPAVI